MKKITLLLFSLFIVSGLHSQTANIYSGCPPLDVDFISPVLDNYYWIFGDGDVSVLANPGHTFSSSGTYLVELYNGQNGPKIGDTTIVVHQPTEFIISANEQTGCVPLQVQFTDESIVSPGLNVTGYFWDFGDGGNSTVQNPTHVYASEGEFTVTLTINSDEEACTTNMSFANFILTDGSISASFGIDKTVECSIPATFTLTNNTMHEDGFTYAWGFGNSETSTDQNPGSITYNSSGTYTIILEVDSGDGCTVNLSRTVIVGEPKIELNVADTFCIGINKTISNTSDGSLFLWNFGDGAIPGTSTDRNPIIRYTTPGAKIVTYSTLFSSDCKSDTFFIIFVEDPSAAFIIDPLTQCSDPAEYNFIHPTPNFAEYRYWIRQLDEEILGTANTIYSYAEPTRDSFYISRADTFTVYLDILTTAGCRAVDSTIFIHRAPQAHFVPSTSRGCAPLTVIFEESSLSTEDITNWEWIFGDGTTSSTTNPDDMTHIYSAPGEYYVKLTIENEAGCRDTSAGIFIYVGEPLNSDISIDRSEICLHESINLTVDNIDPRVDAYHFETDEDRISDCYTDGIAEHTFIHSPGTYPVSLTIEYNGCYNTMTTGENITVNGSKSRIKFMTNCYDPLTVMLQDSSVNATTSIWQLNGDTINMDTIFGSFFNYTFDTTGNYTVTLITDDGTACPADTSIVELSIRKVKAEFELSEYVCADSEITLSAELSTDVDRSCSQGYTWIGVDPRPRTLDIPEVTTGWLPGPFSVSLIVEDVNGCMDTLIKESTALDILADFEIDKDIFCYPNELSFTDLSISDTTIVSWEWSFNETAQNPTNILFADGPNSSLPIKLVITDDIGCMDSITLSVEIYEPTTLLDFDPGSIVCIGETVTINASDYIAQGSFLTYDWKNSSAQTLSTESDLTILVTDPITSNYTLFITEDATGCNSGIDFSLSGIAHPIADIGLNSTEFCASDASILFRNESTIFGTNSSPNGPGTYLWEWFDCF